MIVITLTDCPSALRGDLTKWLLEINTGVFVGKVSARVRENIWERVKKYAKGGRATMVFSAANEQGLDFKVSNSEWEPIDFDGIKLILRPSPSRIKRLNSARKPGYSKASRHLAVSRLTVRTAWGKPEHTRDYVVVDVETTGLTPSKNEIFEISALRVTDGDARDSFTALIRTEAPIPQKIEELTGVTNDMLKASGEELRDVLPRVLEFVGKLPIVAHNASFDASFLNAACRKCGLAELQNELIDTLSMARKKVSNVKGYALKTLAEHFEFEPTPSHRGRSDCYITQLLYEKLLNLQS